TLADDNIAGDDGLTAKFLHTETLGTRIAAVLDGTLTFLMSHDWKVLKVKRDEPNENQPAIEVISSLVRWRRKPLVLWKPLRRLNLNATPLGPRNCCTTLAVTLAPSTTGVPTFTLSPSPTRRASKVS